MCFRSVVIITGSGYIKRMPLEEFEAQSRGGKGKIGARLSTEQDNVAHFFACNDHDTLIFVTDRCVILVIVILNMLGLFLCLLLFARV